MIELLDGLLNNEEVNLLEEICSNFKIEENPPLKNNSYIRMFMNIDTDLVEYQSKIKKYLLLKHGINPKIKGIWINKITTNTNKNDNFHLDETPITVISFLNDNFKGGEFEYISNENKKLKLQPKKNLSLVIDNKLKHRVSPVMRGERYSMVVFCDIDTKNKKTLL